MSVIDKVQVNNTTYDLKDSNLTEEVESIKSALDNKTVTEKVETNGNYTDFNAITTNGVYLVNSALTNGVNGAESANYIGTLIVNTWNHTNNYGTVQIFVSDKNVIHYRQKWATWGDWNVLPKTITAFTATEVQTAYDTYTDFNSITGIGAYLVNSSLINGPVSAASSVYSGVLEVFQWKVGNPYGIKQIFTSSTNDQYIRIYWGNAWTAWEQIAKSKDENALTQIVHSVNILNPNDFKKRGYYYDFTDGTTEIASTTAQMTSPIRANGSAVYIRQTYSDTSGNLLLLYCYDAADNYLGYFYRNYRDIGLNTEYVFALPGNTDKIIVYTNSSTVQANQICISFKSLDSMIAYNDEVSLNESPIMYVHDKLYGKVIANFGDSVFGNKRPPNDISTALANITGATVYNLGFGGCRMSQHDPNWDAFSMYRLADAIATNDFSIQNAVDVDNVSGMPAYFKETRALLESIDFSKVDVVTIAYGTNDFTASVPLDNVNNPLDTITFCGALRYSLQKILAVYPQLHIFVCTPTWRFWMNNGTFLYDSDTHEVGGQLLTDFVEAVKTVSKAYHLTAIDNYYELGINQYNRSHWFPVNDGTHHNKDGGVLIAQHMANELF